ncbi:PREDICTED: uncharacterized protein LOC104809525 [Tarenaya hassleriana]|uniref:uncharacterized protein LOC104809525 n=1 Tax=Tarenaya hassleriana TaxID=28532 RepID=UPI00053C0959|nr:PREDICTED: uncharacterized protein LOC104809525 [Tarenaya hassleriana]
MLEKIGLPAKPSLRGNTWVVDASHCQGCSSQFTFINRKHHCRRCGGLFCNSCTQQRMFLRGQGDSPVRICEPCKKLEEAARFELRHGYKNRTAKGSSKTIPKHEDDILNEILGTDADVSSSSRSVSSMDRTSYKSKASTASIPDVTETARNDTTESQLETVLTSPEELRQLASEEKKKYRVLKGEGKSEEALKAFKRGKELERQAEALEISLRRNRKRVLSLGNVTEAPNKDAVKDSSKAHKPLHQGGKEKDDFADELKELGWSDDEDKKIATISVEGEFSSLLREVPMKSSREKGHGIDKTQVIALKKKALKLKREGKLAEAKEELKKAKLLERELEEQELLAGAEDSDDELSALIRSMDDDKEDDLLGQLEQRRDFDVSNLVGNVDNLEFHGDFDVTEEDMMDPDIASALVSLGWDESSEQHDNANSQPTPTNREERLAEIQSLKREALNLKRAGNVAEAMATLKKAKLLEREIEAVDASNTSSKTVDTAGAQSDLSLKHPTRSRLAIQRELLAVKKKALTLRREGRLDEAEEELKKGMVLQNELDEIDNLSKLAAARKAGFREGDRGNEQTYISGNSLDDDGEVEVKDEDLDDPAYLSTLRSLGWNEEDHYSAGSSSKASDAVSRRPEVVTETQNADDILSAVPKRSKAEIQRELLGLKRKALALRRQGNSDEAEEVLKQTKILEAQMMEMDSGKNLQPNGNQLKKGSIDLPIDTRVNEGDDDVTENDLKDPALMSVLNDLGWKDEEPKPLQPHETPINRVISSSLQTSGPSRAAKSKGQIQRELLDFKRKALAFRRQGKTEEAEELLRKANILEAQLAELESAKSEQTIDASSNVKMEPEGSLPVVSSQKNYMDVDLLAGYGKKQAETENLRNDHSSILSASQLVQENYNLLGDFSSSSKAGSPSKLRKTETGIASHPVQQANMIDLLTGDHGEISQIAAAKGKDETDSDLCVPSRSEPRSHRESAANPERQKQRNPDTETRVLQEGSEGDRYQKSPVQNMSPQDGQQSLRQEILAHKRKAVALKREGRLSEAKEALQQAKLLERRLEGENTPPGKAEQGDLVSSAKAPTVQKENSPSPSSSSPKPLSSRDRFKLQQESLSHKRQAMKLRREGLLQEAEAEFELAKALEAQLEESISHEPSKSEPVDEVSVEDFLDPQLLSALRAIGLDNSSSPQTRTEEKPGGKKASHNAVKPNPVKESSNEERAQLEERVKAEKVKAVA